MIFPSERCTNLGGIDTAAIRSSLMRAGWVILRGFAVDTAAFLSLTESLGAGLVRHGSDRERAGKSSLDIQDVTSGDQPVEPHIEMGRSPFCPELAFFFCKSPATQGGETILVDGHVIASELPDEILEAYRAPLSFVSQYPEELWFKGASSRSIPEVLNFFSCSNHGSLDFRYTGAGSFYCKLETNAFKKSRISKVYSFANSILGPYKGNTAYIGGETISEENYETIRTLYAKYQVIVRLMPNDIVILDNYRIMHGRLKIENGLESRKMFARFVNASSSLLI